MGGSISSNTPIATPTPTFSELTWALPNRDEDGNAVSLERIHVIHS